MRRSAPIGVVAAVLLVVLGYAAYGHWQSGEADRRADRNLYRRLLDEPAGNVRPQDAVRITESEFAPCEGDSGTGPLVVRGYDWAGGPDQLFAFYRAGLEQLGWQSLDRRPMASVGGDFESLVGSKALDGYTLGIEVRTVNRNQQDFELILWADPRQAC